MYLNRLKVVSVITVFILVICNARVLDTAVSYDILDRHFDTILENRQSGSTCIPICTPDSCSDNSCVSASARKRALYSVYDVNNATDEEEFEGAHIIEKRRLTNPRQYNIARYLMGQNTAASLNGICPPSGTGGFNLGSPSFCIQQPFSSAPLNDNAQWLAGTGNTELTGCTVLVIASARAVYICHFWQDLHYMFLGSRSFYGFTPVVNMIRGSGTTPGAVGPALDVSLFNAPNDNTWAFIMTPRSSAAIDDPTQRHFPDQYNILKTVLTELIPGIGMTAYNYDYRVPYANYYQGVALFEYDNNADGNGNADWRLWFEAANERGSKLGQLVAQHN